MWPILLNFSNRCAQKCGSFLNIFMYQTFWDLMTRRFMELKTIKFTHGRPPLSPIKFPIFFSSLGVVQDKGTSWYPCHEIYNSMLHRAEYHSAICSECNENFHGIKEDEKYWFWLAWCSPANYNLSCQLSGSQTWLIDWLILWLIKDIRRGGLVLVGLMLSCQL